MSIHGLVVTSGPRIGDMEAAAVATLVGPQAAVVSGGILCLLGVVVVARLFPELVEHTIRRVPLGPISSEASLDSEP
jgi:ENTS family enterobactin (siderophore) exporter